MGRVIDFTGVSDYKPAPRGTYTVEFTKFEYAETKNGKNAGAEYVKGQWTITDEYSSETDPATGEPIKVEGKVIFYNWSLLPQSLWKLYQDAVILGIPAEDLTGKVDTDELLPKLVGRKAIANVEVRSYAYPEGHAKFGQTRYSNEITDLQEAEIPEVLQPGGRRRG